MNLKSFKLAPVWITTAVLAVVWFIQYLPQKWPALDLFHRLEWITYDWRARQALHHSPAVAPNLGFVFIDDDSIGIVADGTLGYQYGLYWPRHLYGSVVQELHAQGAKLIAFDVLFGELRADHSPIVLPGNKVTGSDAYFAQQMRKASNVVLAASKGVIPPSLFKTNAWALGHIDATADTDGVLRRAKAFAEYRDWHDLIREFARANGADLAKAIVRPGNIGLRLADGTKFEIPVDNEHRFDLYQIVDKPNPTAPPLLEMAFNDRRVWHTGLVMAARELQLDLEHPAIDSARGVITLKGPKGVERSIPVDNAGYLYIDWGVMPNHQSLAQQSVHSILEQSNLRKAGKSDAITNFWKDRLVVIGSTATGNELSDTGATPLETRSFLVAKHWNIANSVITGRFVHRSSGWSEAALVLLMGVLSAGLTWRGRIPWSSAGIVIQALLYLGLSHYLFVQYRYWLPIVVPVLGGLVLNHAAIVSYQVIFEQKEKRRVKGVFAKVVSPNVVNELLEAETLNMGGSRRDITVLFADVRGFTQMTDVNQANAEAYVRDNNLTGAAAEAHYDESAQETLNTVNVYLAAIADQIKKHNGTLDKYIGDCVMAFWGAPTPNIKHAVSCVRAAVDAQRAMYRLNQERAAENKRREEENMLRQLSGQHPLPPLALLSLGTGINSGICIVGLMGSESHILNYTVFGREVNLASRLEGVSGRGRVIIGESTYRDLLKHDPELAATCVAQPPVTVKGIAQAVNIYEVPWKQGLEAAPAASSAATQVSVTGFMRLGDKADGTLMMGKPENKPAPPSAPDSHSPPGKT